MPRKRTKQAVACLEYYNKLHFNFVCPCCNVKTKLNQFNTHSKTKKHLHLMDIFRQDNPDFKESVFLIKIPIPLFAVALFDVDVFTARTTFRLFPYARKFAAENQYS